MQKRFLKKRNRIILIGSLIVLITLGFLTYTKLLNSTNDDIEMTSVIYYLDKINNKTNKQDIEVNKKDNEKIIDYIGVLEIPKINLIRGLVAKNDVRNNVDYNIEILKESTMPNIDNSNLFLAAHSGNSKVSFFRYLYKLNYNDEVYIYYENKKYIYKVNNLYEIEKNGYAEIRKSNNRKHLILITCIDGTEKQKVIICDLIEEKEANYNKSSKF